MLRTHTRKLACPAGQARKIVTGFLALGLLGAVALTAPNASAQTFTTLYSFPGGSGGSQPQAGLIADSSGNLYGTTLSGGNLTANTCSNNGGCGVVFKLAPAATSGGAWTETVLNTFTGITGSQPQTGLISDASGNLYGTTLSGGALSSNLCAGVGCGVAYEVSPSSGETVLYSFAGGNDGGFPLGGLVADPSGNLYGTTQSGGTNFEGTVFELVNASGTFTKKILYSFAFGTGGFIPTGSLTMDTSGDLFGTTTSGGDLSSCGGFGCGVVYELVNSSGTYTEKVLYTFTGSSDGSDPQTGVIADGSGNLYGTTLEGGDTSGCGSVDVGCGVVFELTNSSGTYTYKTLYAFTGGSDGGVPEAGLIVDGAGNLYGTAVAGGNMSDCFGSGCGVIFKVTPSGSETALYSFTDANDGAIPESNLIADGSGNLYGTAAFGGASGYGTAYELSGTGFVPLNHFAGIPGKPNCSGQSISTLAHTYGGIAHAASALGYANVAALHNAVNAYCGGGTTTGQ